MIIELAGLPGAGKSTVSRLAAASLGARSAKPSRSGLTRQSVRHPIVAARHLVPLLPHVTHWHDRMELNWLLRQRLGQESLAVRNSRLVLEEGIVHATAGTLVEYPNLHDAPWEPLVEGASGIVVALEVDVATARERLKQKTTSGAMRNRLLAEPADGETWEHLTSTYERVLSQVSQVRTLHRVDASAAAPRVAQRIVEVVRNSQVE